MTAHAITLTATDGAQVSIPVADWPGQADFSWVGKDEDGRPVLHKGKFALTWSVYDDGTACCSVDWDSTEVNDARDTWGVLSRSNAIACEESATDFQQSVERALTDVEAMRPFADLEQAGAAGHALATRLKVDQARGAWNIARIAVQRMLATHVRTVVDDTAEAISKRATAAYEAEGAPMEDRPGSERGDLRSVPAAIVALAELEGEYRCVSCYRDEGAGHAPGCVFY